MFIKKFRKEAKFANETNGYECAERFEYEWTFDETDKDAIRDRIAYWRHIAEMELENMRSYRLERNFYLARYNFLRANDFVKQLERALNFAA